MPAAVVPAAFEHVEEAGEVGVRIGMRIDQRMAHARLRGEMHDVGKAVRREQIRHRLAVGEVDLLELGKPGTRRARASRACLQCRIVVVIEVVEADHLVPVREQPLRHVHADEAGRTGDENRVACHSISPEPLLSRQTRLFFARRIAVSAVYSDPMRQIGTRIPPHQVTIIHSGRRPR